MKATGPSKKKPAPPADPLLARMRQHPFLRDLKPGLLRKFRECAMGAEFKAGETIFVEGDPANRFYLVESGSVTLQATRRDGGSAVIQTIGAGDVAGWSWLFPPYYWHFSATATMPTRAIFFYGTRLREVADDDKALGYELMKRVTEIVIARLQSTRQKLLEKSAR